MKAKVVCMKGTLVQELDVTPRWQGKSFKELQKSRLMALPSSTLMSVGKGTDSVKASEYPLSHSKIMHKGVLVVTNRGTSSYRL